MRALLLSTFVVVSGCGGLIGVDTDGGTGGGTATGGGAATGVVTPTCASATFQPVPNDFNATPAMAPGQACIACHRGQNFNGQNPNGLSKPNRVYQFMGTVFRTAHEQDLCNPMLSTAASVEIYNMAGTKVLTLNVNSGGNFYGNVAAGMPTPYTAKVVTSAGSRAMVGAQTNGDCNVCHTTLGEQGAPGRVFLP